ncbi:hypothetical protein M947_00910 [Sulfurimonas hongkongensis]|uniref:Uncharacterized protein n=1 Tax=Sulfurimonas hongkongensis TaxID=1172190 RepID=T0KTQ1_9BACT|nr:hypothetical protein [Sulfurimonas hongkongensis]EQB40389.1 hypothetical protein M947_00910 [Sulfurimonas hongkongensis]
MYIKRYTIASLILIALVGWYVYSYISQDIMTLNIFGITLPAMPTAIWVIVPILILYVASVFHMSFYSILSNFKDRKYDKDYEKIIDAVAEAYLAKEEREHSYKTPRYKLLGFIIDNSTLFPSALLKSGVENEKLQSVLKVIEDIKSGEVVELKKYSLKPQNPLVIQNDKNRYKKGSITAENILSHIENYDESLVKEAYTGILATAPITLIEQHKQFLTKAGLFIVLARINASKNPLEISNEALISLINALDLDAKDLIKISTALSTNMIPEQRMKLFEILSEKREDGFEAYIFTLFDLEMIAPANELLLNTQEHEYQNYKAYSALKECGKNFNINLFI